MVTGLVAEAKLARGFRCPVAAGGGTPEGAVTSAERLVSEGATALISFGLAGGLDPALRPGALVIPAAVLEHDAGAFRTDPALSDRLGGVTHPLAMAWDRIVASAASKRVLFDVTGAVCVDLESAAVAQVAARHRLPFAVLRAICDPAEHDLPQAALFALDSAGRIAGLRVAASLLSRPGQIPALFALARDAAAARRALLGRARAVGPL